MTTREQQSTGDDANGSATPEIRFVIEDDSVASTPAPTPEAAVGATPSRRSRTGRLGASGALGQGGGRSLGERVHAATTRPSQPSGARRVTSDGDVDGEVETPSWLARSGDPAAGPAREDLIDLQVRHLLITVVAAVLLAGGLIVIANTAVGRSLSLYYPVAIVGSLGGTAHTYRRLRRLADADPELLAAVPRRLAVAQVYLSPVIGAAFAAVLHTIFIAGLLQGEVFPTFTCAGEAYADYARFADCGPATNADVAMALVWAFLAGFAEHWVPTLLDGLVPEDKA